MATQSKRKQKSVILNTRKIKALNDDGVKTKRKKFLFWTDGKKALNGDAVKKKTKSCNYVQK